jgi:nucleotide-binding universal stress UspA family protein
MTGNAQHAATQRIVVTLDTSEAGRSVLDIAVRLAATLPAELEGVFIEDVNLINLAGLPFLREIRAHSLVSEAVTAERMQRDLRAVARQAERMLAQAAATMGVTSSFRVWRGDTSFEALSEHLKADILSLTRLSGSTVPRLAPLRTAAKKHPIEAVRVVLTGERLADRALALARRLAGDLSAPLQVYLPTTAPQLEQRLTTEPGDQAQRASVTYFDDLETLMRELGRTGNAVLVVGRDGGGQDDRMLGRCLGALTCPVLVLR